MKYSHKREKQGAPPNHPPTYPRKTNFKYSCQKCHLRNFHQQRGRRQARRHEQTAGWTLTAAVTYSPLVWNVRVRAIRGPPPHPPDICVSSARRPLRMASLKDSDSSGLETQCRDNESKWVYLLERWRRVCISGSSSSGGTEKVTQDLQMSQIFT